MRNGRAVADIPNGMTTTTSQSADESRADRRQRYEHVLRTVQHNTGGPQPALVPEFVLLGILGNASIEPDAAKRSIRAAVENDDLLAHEGAYAVVDKASLRAVIEAEVASDGPTDTTLVGRCNELIDGLEGES